MYGTGEKGTATITLNAAVRGAKTVSFDGNPYWCFGFTPGSSTVPDGGTQASFTLNPSNPGASECQAQARGWIGNTYGTTTVTITPRALGGCPECEGLAGSGIDLTTGNVQVQQNDYSLPGSAEASLLPVRGTACGATSITRLLPGSSATVGVPLTKSSSRL